MTALKNCPACGAITEEADTKCKICGASLKDQYAPRSFKDLPPPPEDSGVASSGAKLPRPSNPPMAVPRQSEPPEERIDSTMKVPFSGKKQGAKNPDLPRPSSPPPDPGKGQKKTMMMPALGLSSAPLGEKKVPVPRPSEPPPPKNTLPPPPPPKTSPAKVDKAPPAAPSIKDDSNTNKTLLGVPSQLLLSPEALAAAKALDKAEESEIEGIDSEAIETTKIEPETSVPKEDSWAEITGETDVSVESNKEPTPDQPIVHKPSAEELLGIPEPAPEAPAPSPAAAPPSPGMPSLGAETPKKKSPLPIFIGIGAVVIIAVVVVIVFVMGGEDTSAETDTEAVANNQVAETPKDTGEAPKDTGQTPKDTGEAPKDTGQTPKDTGQTPKDTGQTPKDTGQTPKDTGEAENVKAANPTLLGDPTATCKALGDYPKFPYKKHLTGLLEALGTDSVCAMFGNVEPGSVKAGFSELASTGPYKSDLLEGVSTVFVFPEGDVDYEASHIELTFFEKELFEVKFNYIGSYPGKVPVKSLKKLLGKAGKPKKDRLGRWYSKYTDEDMVVLQMEKKVGKKKHKWVVFAHPETSQKVDDLANKKVRAATEAFHEGMTRVGERKYNQALKSMRDARREKKNFGMAYAAEAMLLVLEEKYGKAGDAAKNAIEKGKSQRAGAEAHVHLATIALAEGKKDKALEHYAKSAAIDPTNPIYPAYIDELETGDYTAERVAETAARIGCLGTAVANGWTRKGILSRGNYEDNASYKKALGKVSESKAFKKAKKERQQMECR